jgi:prevent-host-death family protein
MGLSSQIKPISYLKTHVSEIFRQLGEQSEPLIITQNGEAKAILQDIQSYEKQQETMALLKMLALGNRQIEDGNIHVASDVVQSVRQRRNHKYGKDGR